MSLIQDIKEDLLFERVNKEKTPFFQWFKWIETTINAEVLKFLFNSKQQKPEQQDSKTKAVPKSDKQTIEKEKVKQDLSNYLET